MNAAVREQILNCRHPYHENYGEGNICGVCRANSGDISEAKAEQEILNSHAELKERVRVLEEALEHLLSAAYEMTSPRSVAFQEADAEARAALSKEEK